MVAVNGAASAASVSVVLNEFQAAPLQISPLGPCVTPKAST